jgi:hypothetical protein
MINDKLIEIIKELKKKFKTDSEIIAYLTGTASTSEIKEHLAYYYKNNPSKTDTVFEKKQTENTPAPGQAKPVINESFVSNNNFNSSIIKEEPKLSKKSNYKMTIIITIIIILVIGLLIFFLIPNNFSKDISNKNNDFNSIDTNNLGNTDLNLTNLDVNNNLDINSVSEIADEVIDCGYVLVNENTIDLNGYNCFIEASRTCNPAMLLNEMSIEFFGLITTSNSEMKIKGLEEEKCIFYQKTIDQTFEFSPETIQEALDSGVTQEEIDLQLQTMNEENKELVYGLETICKFNQTDLTEMLIRWSDGNLSSEDLSPPRCQTTIQGEDVNQLGNPTIIE